MGVFEQFPYTNYHDQNSDWMLQTVKQNAEICTQVSGEWNQVKGDVEKLLTTQTNILDEAKAYADGAADSVNKAHTSEVNAKASETTSLSNANLAAGYAADAHQTVQNISTSAQAIVNQATQMEVVYDFFQSISDNISDSATIQTAAQQIAIAVANTMVIDGGDPSNVVSKIIDGGSI